MSKRRHQVLREENCLGPILREGLDNAPVPPNPNGKPLGNSYRQSRMGKQLENCIPSLPKLVCLKPKPDGKSYKLPFQRRRDQLLPDERRQANKRQKSDSKFDDS